MHSKRKYTHLFFDLDNTLWDFNTNSYHAMKNAFARFERHLNETEFDHFFDAYYHNNRLLWDEYRKGNVIKKELVTLRFQKTFDELQIKGIDPLEMNDTYLEAMPLQTKLVAGAEPVLEYLKKRGYKLFVITNGFMQVQHKKLESAGIRNFFKKIFISEEIKSPKPAPEIFEHALKSANAPKTKSLMIGDDLESDIKGALNFGIDTVYLNPLETNQEDLDALNVNSRILLYRIKTLSELTRIL